MESPLNLVSDRARYAGIEIKENQNRRKLIYIFFGIWSVLTFAGVISGYWQLSIIKELQTTGMLDENKIALSDAIHGGIGLLQTLVYVATAICFLLWFRRAYANLHRIGIDHLKHKESWAIWSWIVPIVSLWFPPQIMSEIWTETAEKAQKLTESFQLPQAGFMIAVWWVLFLIDNVLARFLMKTMFNDETLEELIRSTEIMMLSDGVGVLEAASVIFLVWTIGKMENAMATGIQSNGGTVLFK